MITNNYLFASQFLNYLASLKIADEEQFNAFKNTIQNFFNKESSTSDSDSFITLTISLLGFTPESPKSYNESEFSKYYLLHQGVPVEQYPVVSCLYFVKNNVDLDSCVKGLFPAYDLISLLKNNKIEWGILTNGKVWRLYSTLSALPYENYIEINFGNSQDIDYKVFWQLFTVHLFIPDENEITPLEKFIEESNKESQLIEKHIKANIDDILENITMGFITYSNKLNQELSDNEKQEYFDNSVYLLFRLLFVFYAESRGLLPIKNNSYFEISLENLLKKTKKWAETGIPDNNGTELWDSFRDLCSDIDTGNFTSQIPEYDGGLFAIDEHKFLNDPKNKICNLFFSKILNSLGYYKKGKREIKIEYRDLSVRSIGSLYEGILEYKLFLAEEDLIIRGEKIISKRLAGNQKKTDKLVNKGSVYFSQDADERHDTGSYYTPEDVVNYMVQNSVRIALEDKWIKFLPVVKNYEAELKKTTKDTYRDSILNKFDNELLKFIENVILNFKVIDPTMGSGHFLVNSLNTITNFIVEVLQTNVNISKGQIKHTEDIIDINWSLFYHFNNKINLEPSVWRRKVVERCIFGIDINPLATELAKLSLWIASSSYGKPLAFINHHIKCGDAIIGAKLEDIFKYPEREDISNTKINIFEKIKEDRIIELKKKFEALFHYDSDLMENIRKKKGLFDEIEKDPLLNRLKDVSTLWIMINYAIKGNNSFSSINNLNLIDSEKYYTIIESLDKVNTIEEWKNILGYDLYNNIKKCKNIHKIFHWELEYPEIINVAFDIGLGNPPYVDVNANSYIGLNLKSVNSTNLYAYVPNKCFEYLVNDGMICFITPMAIICSKRMIHVQDIFKEHTWILMNIDATSHPGTLFDSVQTSINIFTVKKNSKNKIYTTNYKRFYSFERKLLFNKNEYYNLNNKELILKYTIPKINSSVEENILKIILNTDKRLTDYLSETNETENRIYYRSAGNPYYRLAFAEPEYMEVNGNKIMSTSQKSINLRPEYSKYIMLCIFYSNLYYWFWTVYSDCFNFHPKDLFRFPIDYDLFNSFENEFKMYYEKVYQDLLNNSVDVTYNKANGITKYKQYKARYSKSIFDEIDVFLSKIYGFEDKMVEFLKYYDIKYRTD